MARSLRPFSVMTTSGLCLAISAQVSAIQSSSSFSSAALRQGRITQCPGRTQS